MVQMMESWFFADKETLEKMLSALPTTFAKKIGRIEALSKDEMYRCLSSIRV